MRFSPVVSRVVVVNPNSPARDGRKFSLTEKDGALVLNIVTIPGLMLIIR